MGSVGFQKKDEAPRQAFKINTVRKINIAILNG